MLKLFLHIMVKKEKIKTNKDNYLIKACSSFQVGSGTNFKGRVELESSNL